MTKEEKAKLFKPKPCGLYENGVLIETFDSHTKAKNAKFRYEKEAEEDWLDLEYEIKPL